MGSKDNPVGLRIGIIKDWNSSWYARKGQYAKMLLDDRKIREFILKRFPDHGISTIELQRNVSDISLVIHSAKPGVLIGREGSGVEELKKILEKEFKYKFSISVKEIKKPELDAYLVARNIATQIERRVSYRRAAKMAVQKAIAAGAKGIKIRVGGRLNGVEIARTEFTSEGRIPLHTFRADIDYCSTKACTTYGTIGVKVWINKGMVFSKSKQAPKEPVTA